VTENPELLTQSENVYSYVWIQNYSNTPRWYVVKV